MRNIILSSILIFSIISCSSRKINIEKTKETQKIIAENNEHKQQKTDSSSLLKLNKMFNLSENTTNKEFVFIKEYYPSGTLKSERWENKDINQNKQQNTNENIQQVIYKTITIDAEKSNKEKKDIQKVAKEKKVQKHLVIFAYIGFGAVLVIAIHFLFVAFKNRLKIKLFK